MRTLNIILLALGFSLFVSCVSTSRGEMADLVLLNGVVWTVNPDQPWAEAVAIKGEKICKVGSTTGIEKMVGDKTVAIDLKGDFVLPGFIDSHTTFFGWRIWSFQYSVERGKKQGRIHHLDCGESERTREGRLDS